MTHTTQSLGNGFFHHGVATATSNHRGIVTTTDGEGRNVVLVWLFDPRWLRPPYVLMQRRDKAKSS